MATVPSISGTELVLSALGHWPSFHDSEVTHFRLFRGETTDAKKSDAELDVKVREYETRNEGSAEYELVLTKNVLIRFAFAGVEEVQVEDFNFQNVINSLTIEKQRTRDDERIRVEVESIFGFGATWLCRSATVTDVSHLTTL